MRAIKFRAWDTDRGVMVIPDWISYDGEVYDDVSDLGPCHSESYTLMQFTGLNDKNGVEIYEGDIVKVDDGSYSGEVKFNIEDLSYVIENSEGGFGFVNGQRYDERPEYRTYEVIGNIYEGVRDE